MKKVYPERSRRGLTAIEMIVVISIIGIMAGMIVPTISKYLPGIQLNGSARNLSNDLRQAQELTVAEQNKHLIRFFPTDNPVKTKYQLIRIYNSKEEIIKDIVLSSTITITLDEKILDSQIAFSSDGGPSSSGNITISNGSSQKVINVSTAGFVSIH